jgi:hypothetical protein
MENGDPASGQKMYIGSDPLPVYSIRTQVMCCFLRGFSI